MQPGVIITKVGLHTTTQLKSGLYQIKLKLANLLDWALINPYSSSDNVIVYY